MGDNPVMRTVALVLLLLGSACQSTRYFAPRENANGTSPSGETAAVYPVTGGEVRVWSRGARWADAGGIAGDHVPDEQAEVHVGFEIENTGQELLTLDLASLQLEDLWEGERHQSAVHAQATVGVPTAEPGATARLEAVFWPVGGGHPRDIDGFSVRFAVLSGKETALTQVTPFAPAMRQRWRDDRWYDDSFYYGYRPYGLWGPWGFGFHSSIGWCH